ncbi:hypothetical protein C8J57DRAFT_1465053 [Mycena rebaudengoi]|nr:hypothetical protein C8J57DRAFT_1465053 [Mycena rebaudengoi]
MTSVKDKGRKKKKKVFTDIDPLGWANYALCLCPISVEQLTAKYSATVFGDYDLDFEPAASTAGVDADDEGEGDVVGSNEEGESSDARGVGSFIDDAGASEAEQDDTMYDEEEDFGDAQTSDEDGATAGNQASFAAAFDVEMENTEREIFGGSDSDDSL